MTTRTAKKHGGTATALVWALLMAVGAGSEGRAADITVSKGTGDDAGMFKTIQEAVNAAKPGQVIEILDTEIYDEQVTIDGRGEWNTPSEWDGKNQGPIKRVMGGKNGITIRYAPTGARLFGNHARPTIRWKDTENRSPKNYNESKVEGQLPGQSGNFETNGALRILWAQGVTIDGIKVDGGGLAPFENKAVWDQKYPLFHGNAAITLAVAGGTIIKNCDITNGYFGINIKDRNTGGVFGNPNPADNDKTIPLSGFGKVGNHLFEYNKIHGNMTGMFFESSWDLGSTIRYNLIYSNIHDTKALPTLEDPSNAIGGAILFKDVKYTPVAIYNNTFYNNTGNIMGGWKVGTPHLIFNNIFGKPSYAVGVQTAMPNSVGNAMFEHKFPYRMHNSLFSATADLKFEKRNMGDCKRDAVRDSTGKELIPGIYGQEIFGITQVRISNNIPNPTPGATQVTCLAPIDDKTVSTNEFIPHGALLTGTVFETSANIRWLETTKSIDGTENLFVSTDTASTDFLKPRWDHPLVGQFIKGKGWKDIGMKNSDGSDADIGAISSTGRALATEARIKPSNVVLVNGTNAKASFRVDVEGGQMNNAKISFLRWVAPLPTNPPDPSGNAAPAVPKSSHTIINSTSGVTVNGNNTVSFTIPALPPETAADSLGQYGFFEVVVSGTDANGNPVTSDIGFLPYRKLSYTLKIEVFAPGSNTPTKTVNAGEQYTLKVTPCKGSDPATCGSYTESNLSEISYELQSDAAAFMYKWGTETPLTYDGPDAKMGSGGKTYDVYFTRAGAETIMGSGVAPLSGDNRLVFLGTADITVKPGVPDHIIFTDPIPLSQLGTANAPVINRGVGKSVTVEVQDKYGNTVEEAVKVTISSDKTDIGDVGAPGSINTKTVTTDGTTGIATFEARVTNGKVGDNFDMTATATWDGKTIGPKADKENIARLRVGRALDRLQVFYSDADGVYDPNAKIEGLVGDGKWYKITVKVLVGDSLATGQTGKYVEVWPGDDRLVFYPTPDGTGTANGPFSLTDGVAVFYVGVPLSSESIEDACIDVLALTGSKDPDGGITMNNRCNIWFKKPDTKILRAVVYGNGNGQPDSLLIHYKDGTNLTVSGKPAKVELMWPTTLADANRVTLSADGSRLKVVDDTTLSVNLVGLGTNVPKGYTTIAEDGLLKVYNNAADPSDVEPLFPLEDGIGPILAKSGQAGGTNPQKIENTGNPYDTLVLTVSENISCTSIKTLLWDNSPSSPDGLGSGGTSITVEGWVQESSAKCKVTVAAGTLDVGDWIRFNSADGIKDGKLNAVLADNRWAQLTDKQVQPTVSEAWYTSNDSTGRVNYIYIRFSKGVDIDSWFSGEVIDFGAGKPKISTGTAGVFTPASPGSDTLVVNLEKANVYQDKVMTSGSLSFILKYTATPPWDDPYSVPLVDPDDRANPVLAEAVEMRIGVDGAKDTLLVYYSEEVKANFDMPLEIKSQKDGTLCQPILTPLSPSGTLVKYAVDDMSPCSDKGFTPGIGDLVHIYVGGSEFVADGKGNEQRASNNRWVKLDVKIEMVCVVKNNPFKANEAALGNSGGLGIEIRPKTGSLNGKLYGGIKIFDNLGALVVDTSFTKDNVKDDQNGKIMWNWNGTNKKGRVVGTGTYLLRAWAKSEDGSKKLDVVNKPLGVVRGKK